MGVIERTRTESSFLTVNWRQILHRAVVVFSSVRSSFFDEDTS
jgi:hypothetical protein